ncbi:MAG: M48 family metallopeptidase [Candidatus Gracilibacteria bacterium]|nr:M48 family metallopeptidase [Candidatus Gracilibacteria bacterium]
MYSTIFYIILGLYVFEFVFSKTLSYLNTLNWSDKLPTELSGIYDAKKYSDSMKYEKVKYSFGTISAVISFFVMYFVLVFGGFGYLYDLISTYTTNEILRPVYFFGIIVLLQTIFSLPFSYYFTFVIEEKFGFNKSTKKLFFMDTMKSLLLSAVFGLGLLSLITWIYLKTADNFWLYTWIVMTFFSVFMMMFYSSIIVPLFNKQTPLEKGELREAIEKFATKVGFKLDNIFVIDGSKRSSKANAYFSGFGPKKRIVLYDTLISDLSTDELVGVLAHEIGHYKKKHTLQMLTFSIVQTGLMLYILGLALKIPEISYAMGSSTPSFAVGLVAFGLLYTPISMIFGLLGNLLSRKNEYEADQFAGTNFNPTDLKNALIKLSRNNLSNLRPHPAYEFFNYSHPTVLKRLKALDEINKNNE